MTWWQRFRCRIGWHLWGPWRPETFKVSNFKFGVRVGEPFDMVYQTRYCRRCKVMATRPL